MALQRVNGTALQKVHHLKEENFTRPLTDTYFNEPNKFLLRSLTYIHNVIYDLFLIQRRE